MTVSQFSDDGGCGWYLLSEISLSVDVGIEADDEEEKEEDFRRNCRPKCDNHCITITIIITIHYMNMSDIRVYMSDVFDLRTQ